MNRAFHGFGAAKFAYADSIYGSSPWASADFFPGGQKHTICLKMPKTYYFISKKSKNILFCHPRVGKCPLLPSPADAHAQAD